MSTKLETYRLYKFEDKVLILLAYTRAKSGVNTVTLANPFRSEEDGNRFLTEKEDLFRRDAIMLEFHEWPRFGGVRLNEREFTKEELGEIEPIKEEEIPAPIENISQIAEEAIERYPETMENLEEGISVDSPELQEEIQSHFEEPALGREQEESNVTFTPPNDDIPF